MDFSLLLLSLPLSTIAMAQFPAPADVSAAPNDAIKTASGLAYKVLRQGNGTSKPSSTSVVTVHYTGWLKDGTMFDSSVSRGEPKAISLNQVITGWTEGQLMVEGEKTRFWIPTSLAYQGKEGYPAGDLVFDVELLAIKELPKSRGAAPNTAKP